MRDSGRSETFPLWPGSGRPETGESLQSHCRSGRGPSERVTPNKSRQGETGRSVRQRPQAGAAPTFQAVQRDRSVRAEEPQKGNRRAGNGVTEDPNWGPAGQQCPRRIPERETAWDSQDPAGTRSAQGSFSCPHRQANWTLGKRGLVATPAPATHWSVPIFKASMDGSSVGRDGEPGLFIQLIPWCTDDAGRAGSDQRQTATIQALDAAVSAHHTIGTRPRNSRAGCGFYPLRRRAVDDRQGCSDARRALDRAQARF